MSQIICSPLLQGSSPVQVQTVQLGIRRRSQSETLDWDLRLFNPRNRTGWVRAGVLVQERRALVDESVVGIDRIQLERTIHSSMGGVCLFM